MRERYETGRKLLPKSVARNARPNVIRAALQWQVHERKKQHIALDTGHSFVLLSIGSCARWQVLLTAGA